MSLAHVCRLSRVVNTVYGLGKEDTMVTLDGGLAQGANRNPALFCLIQYLHSGVERKLAMLLYCRRRHHQCLAPSPRHLAGLPKHTEWACTTMLTVTLGLMVEQQPQNWRSSKFWIRQILLPKHLTRSLVVAGVSSTVGKTNVLWASPRSINSWIH